VKHVPLRKLKSGKHKKALWMTNEDVQAVKSKHKVFSQYKDITILHTLKHQLLRKMRSGVLSGILKLN